MVNLLKISKLLRFNNIVPKFRSVVLPLLAGLLVVACQKKEETLSPEEASGVKVVAINVAADNISTRAGAATRAEVAPTTEEATINTLRIFAFVGTTRVGYAYFDNLADVDLDQRIFYLDLTMLSNTMNVAFYLVANEASMIQPTGVVFPGWANNPTRTQIENYYFTSQNYANGLPMLYAGEVTVDMATNSTLTPTDPDHASHILIDQQLHFELNRPIAKLGIFAAKTTNAADDELIINSIWMHNASFRSYLVPQTEETLKNLLQNQDRQLAFASPFTVTKTMDADADQATRLNVVNYDDVIDTTATPVNAVYMRENPYGSTDPLNMQDSQGRYLVINYSFNGIERVAAVYMPVIERDKYYRVLCLFTGAGTLTIEYNVADWTDAALWEHDFGYPSYTVQDLNGLGDYSNPEIFYNPDATSSLGTFSFQFQMTYPEGQSWEPVMNLGSNTDYSITITDEDGNVVTNPTASANSGWYTITVRVLNSDTNLVGNVIEVGISSPFTWLGTNSLLLINGEANDITWEGSGTIPEYIDIDHVASPVTVVTDPDPGTGGDSGNTGN